MVGLPSSRTWRSSGPGLVRRLTAFVGLASETLARYCAERGDRSRWMVEVRGDGQSAPVVQLRLSEPRSGGVVHASVEVHSFVLDRYAGDLERLVIAHVRELALQLIDAS